MKAPLLELLRTAATAVLAEAGTSGGAPPIVLDATRDPRFGDFQTNLALQLAKPLRLPPRAVAEALVRHLPASARVAKVEIAGPGFINFFLAPGAFQAVIPEILAQRERFGRDDSGARGKVMVEFVSANPTGPLHVGHGRGAAYGDALANLLTASGWTVWREYYVNDAGRQVDVLTASVWLRYLELCGERLPAFPTRLYQGDYIRTTAAALRDASGDRHRVPAAPLFAGAPSVVVEGGDEEAAKRAAEELIDHLVARLQAAAPQSFAQVRDHALAVQLAAIRATLEEFGVAFDQWYSEADLVASGAAARARAQLVASGHTYEKDGALWFRTTERGDDKDRVLVRANGTPTYFGNDLAYHVDKLGRGWTRLIDVWGADHHGLLVRMRAAIEALTGRRDALDVQLIQFVTLSSGKMGKRSGNYVTLQDLLGEAGRDATRFFYLSRSHDQHLEFDIDLARSQTTENPVFYVQYAHARIASVFAQLGEKGGTWRPQDADGALQRLDTEHEKALLVLLNRYPEAVRKAADDETPHSLVHFLRELAEALHAYYNVHRFLSDDAPLQAARLGLAEATGQVLRNGLVLLGVSAPQKM